MCCSVLGSQQEDVAWIKTGESLLRGTAAQEAEPGEGREDEAVTRLLPEFISSSSCSLCIKMQL